MRNTLTFPSNQEQSLSSRLQLSSPANEAALKKKKKEEKETQQPQVSLIKKCCTLQSQCILWQTAVHAFSFDSRKGVIIYLLHERGEASGARDACAVRELEVYRKEMTSSWNL